MYNYTETSECPNCKSPVWMEVFYETKDQYINCNTCGYHVSTFKKDPGITGFAEGNIEMQETKNPYGVVKVTFFDSPGTTNIPVMDEVHFDMVMKEMSYHSDVKSVELSRFVDNQVIVEHII